MLLSVVGVVAVTIALTGAFGGLGARPSAPAAVSPGATVDQGLFKVQVLDARTGRLKIGVFGKADNKLVVRARVTNTGDRSWGVISFLSGVVAEPKPGQYVKPDMTQSNGDLLGGTTTEIHPRLPVTVQLVWPLPETTTPRSVTLALRAWQYGQAFTTNDIGWSVTSTSPVTAKVTLPVRAGATS
ncbi:hypothetical protein GCM10023196_107790 [Actinoallomurus vinaceus]|uniref:DUF4352 domain-containing protein n=1 Tax=Actinoallomurus vinaceus TaxID=1080074 RepID=A0ABP8UX77_9ACTN